MGAYRKAYVGAEYAVNYSMMGGVDFSSPDSASGRRRYAYLENMYRDYDGEGAEVTESVPGFRKLFSLGERINGFYLQRIKKGEEYLIIHSGKKLYRVSLSELDEKKSLSSIKNVSDTKSAGFAFGKNVYLLDGTKLLRIDEEGVASYVSDSTAAAPYVPTTYVNGREYEQLNLLTRQFYEETYVAFAEELADASPGLEYRILDKDLKKCAVTGISNSFSGNLYIPAFTKIGDELYEIERIDEMAFSDNLDVKCVTIADGVREIAKKAFSCASKLTKATLPDSVREIGVGAFESCIMLEEIRLGKELVTIGNGAFSNCINLVSVKYANDAAAFSIISPPAGFPEKISLTEYSRLDTIRIKIPVKTPTDTLSELLVGDESLEFYEELEGELVKSIVVPAAERKKLCSATIRIRGYANRYKFNFNSPGINFISGMSGGEPSEAITKCTLCECFDGRVFLSGNPSYPNTVFYAARDKTGNVNPLYFGVMNYFNDGVGSYPVISLLSAGDSLAVFKSGDDGAGSIYYHEPKETSLDILPKIYPVSYIHSGISALGASISFFDDPIFISAVGASALDKKAINLERSVACRSHNVNPELLSENLAEASLAIWCGYLVILVEGKIYLADSRALFRHETGALEYEWYYLSGIGTYTGDDFAYEYIKSDTRECETYEEKLGLRTSATVFSATDEAGFEYFYTQEGGKKYRVGRSGERVGGSFNPASIAFSPDGALLFFGTKNGDVCLFNNDKRGVAPERLAASEGFDQESYEAFMKRSIHPDFYSFDSHAPRYALSTVTDDGDVPDMTKDTIRSSLVIKCKCFGHGSFTVEVGTDKKGYSEISSFSDSRLDFEDFDFTSLAFFGEKRISVPIAERERGWVEKSVSLYSDGFCSPFGIYSISYRFRPRGKIKNLKL